MDCLHVKERLSPYLEGLLPAVEHTEIKEHLDSCHLCREHLAGLEQTVRLLGTLPEIEPPLWLSQKVMAKVRAEADRRQGIFRRLFYPLHIKLPIEALAAVLITAAVVYIMKSEHPGIEQAVQLETPAVRPMTEEPKISVPSRDEAPARQTAGPRKRGEAERGKAGGLREAGPEEKRPAMQPPPAAKAKKTVPAEQAAVKPAAPVPGSVRTDEDARFSLKAKEEFRTQAGVRRHINTFILNGLDIPIGNTKEEIIRNLGRPENEHVEKVQNVHEPGGADERTRISYDGLSVTIYRSAKTGREFITGISVMENRYPLKLGIRLGSTASEIKAVLGDPESESVDTLTYVTDGAPSFVHFRLQGNSVKRIDWDFYSD